METKQEHDSTKERILNHELKTWTKDKDKLQSETTQEETFTEKLQEVLTDFDGTEERLRDMDREELIREALSLNLVARDILNDFTKLTDRLEIAHRSYGSISVDTHPRIDAGDDLQLRYALAYLVKTAKRNKNVLSEEKRPRQITEHEKEMVRMGLQDFGVTQGAVSRIIGRSKSTVNKVANNYED